MLDQFNSTVLWSLDTIGITDKTDNIYDKNALKMFYDYFCFENKRYCVIWPWKALNINLLVNNQLFLSHLNAQHLCYKDSPEVFKQYHEIIESQIESGIIEKVNDQIQSSTRTHYISHHAVIKQDNNTIKLRILYDGSAKLRKDNTSINDSLYRGPIMLQDLLASYSLSL